MQDNDLRGTEKIKIPRVVVIELWIKHVRTGTPGLIVQTASHNREAPQPERMPLFSLMKPPCVL